MTPVPGKLRFTIPSPRQGGGLGRGANEKGFFVSRGLASNRLLRRLPAAAPLPDPPPSGGREMFNTLLIGLPAAILVALATPTIAQNAFVPLAIETRQ